MKITITGSLGNVSKWLAPMLVRNGHEVTIVTSDPQKAIAIGEMGARPAIGSVSDVGFLSNAFKGADAVYTMVPPNWNATDYRSYIGETGTKYRDAINVAGVKRVVNLSSVGAHLTEKTGPIAGLHDVEQRLNTLDHVAVRHLRPGLFFTNFLFDIGTIRQAGVMGNNYGSETPLVMVHPLDIAEAAAEELQRSFAGKGHRYVASERMTAADAVKILGTAIGKPNLPWVRFGDGDTVNAMVAAGMSPAIAALYVEMGTAIGSGILFEDFNQHGPAKWGHRTLADFAKEFSAAFNTPRQTPREPSPSVATRTVNP